MESEESITHNTHEVETNSEQPPREKTPEEIEQLVEEIRKNEIDFRATKRLDVLTDEEWTKFKNEVKAAKGTLRIFIHPTHVSNNKEAVDNGTFSYFDYPPTKMLLTTAINKSSPPILILEDEDKFDANRIAYEEIAKRPEYNPNIYILPTIHNNGFIKLIDKDQPMREVNGSINLDTLRYGQVGIWGLVNEFHNAGVRKVLIAGSSLKVGEDYLGNCVGTFVHYFRELDRIYAERKPDIESIKIEMSTATSPHGRKELREKGYHDLL
jgi:hypothetical protein